MGDISTWNPVDNSNTTAPPDGWPEGMAPSAVNNCARAMMGAVRRWYDTVTAQLATYLPLSGGTLTGTLNAPYLHSTGNVVADVDLGGRDLNLSRNVNAGGDLHLTGTTAFFSGATGAVNTTGGPLLYADTNNHVYKQGSGNGAFIFQNYAGANVANLSAAGILSCNTVHSTGNVVADVDLGGRDLNLSRNANVTGTVTAGGNITAPAFIGNVSVPASGPVTTGGTVTGGQVTSTGNINASGNITGANLLAGSSVYVAGQPALSVTTAGRLDILTPSGDLALVLYGSPTWQNSYFNNTHQFGNSGRDFTYATFGIAGTFNQSGTWGTLSDASLKDDVAPYERGLDAILALSPVSFRYRDGTPFADPERTVRYGLVAQDVAGVIPEMVGETTLDTGGTVGTVFPGHLVYVLVTAAKELAAQNAALAARITALEGNHV